MSQWWIICLGLLLVPGLSAATRRVQGGQPVTLTLTLHYPAVVAFPEPIARVMGLGKAEQGQDKVPEDRQPVSFDVYNHLLMISLIQPEAVGRIVVIGESGTRYLVNFKPGTPGDDDVEVLSSRQPPAGQPGAASAGGPMTLAAWLRELKMQRTLPGQVPAEIPLPLFPDTRLRILAATNWGLPQGFAQILTLENTTRVTLTLDERIGEDAETPPSVVALTAWTWPQGLSVKLAHVDAQQLFPGAQTRVFLLYQRRDAR